MCSEWEYSWNCDLDMHKLTLKDDSKQYKFCAIIKRGSAYLSYFVGTGLCLFIIGEMGNQMLKNGNHMFIQHYFLDGSPIGYTNFFHDIPFADEPIAETNTAEGIIHAE